MNTIFVGSSYDIYVLAGFCDQIPLRLSFEFMIPLNLTNLSAHIECKYRIRMLVMLNLWSQDVFVSPESKQSGWKVASCQLQ